MSTLSHGQRKTMVILTPPTVYWFYEKGFNQRRSSVASSSKNSSSTELTRKNWEPFNAYDNNILETNYLQIVTGQRDNSDCKVAVFPDRLFEVDIIGKKFYPIYWNEDVFLVRRGMWFKDTGTKANPLEEELSLQIEEVYMEFMSSCNNQPMVEIETETPDKPESQKRRFQLTGSYSKMYCYFQDSECGWLVDSTPVAQFARFIDFQAGEKLCGTKLIRGWDDVRKRIYPLTATSPLSSGNVSPPDDRMGPTSSTSSVDLSDICRSEKSYSHLILAIHGIGQKLGDLPNVGIDFIKDVENIRKRITKGFNTLKKGKEFDEKAERNSGVLVLPIRWKQDVEFEGNNDDRNFISLEDITLSAVPGVRALVSSTVLDVLLYMTPKYRKSIINKVINEMNRVYDLFVARNPTFLENGGKVSILGHSLGSVIAFDILDNAKMDEPNVPVNFNVHNFFAVGSPIGMFLLLRSAKLGSVHHVQNPKDILPGHHYLQSTYFYNIFHPYDPVAYRVEPFVCKSYISVPPFEIPYHKGGIRGLQNDIATFSTDMKTKTAQQFRNFIGTLSGLAKLPPNTSEDPLKNSSQNSVNLETIEKESNALQDFNPYKRIDFALQVDALSIQYLSSLTVHVNYWTDSDLAYFLAQNL